MNASGDAVGFCWKELTRPSRTSHSEYSMSNFSTRMSRFRVQYTEKSELSNQFITFKNGTADISSTENKNREGKKRRETHRYVRSACVRRAGAYVAVPERVEAALECAHWPVVAERVIHARRVGAGEAHSKELDARLLRHTRVLLAAEENLRQKHENKK